MGQYKYVKACVVCSPIEFMLESVTAAVNSQFITDIHLHLSEKNFVESVYCYNKSLFVLCPMWIIKLDNRQNIDKTESGNRMKGLGRPKKFQQLCTNNLHSEAVHYVQIWLLKEDNTI